MKQRPALSLAGLAAAVLAAGAAQAAGPALYDTGPSQDAAFVRFVNATPQALDVVSGKARLPLSTDKPVSDYLSVKPDSSLGGTLEGGGQSGKVSVKTRPGAFSTVVALPGAGGKGIATTVVSDTPDDFNALKSAIAFYNVDASCKPAGLQAAGRNVAIFKDVGDQAVQRRMVNPVALAVQPTCGGQPRGASVDLGQLKAGERYSLLLVPAGNGASRLVFATDNLAR